MKSTTYFVINNAYNLPDHESRVPIITDSRSVATHYAQSAHHYLTILEVTVNSDSALDHSNSYIFERQLRRAQIGRKTLAHLNSLPNTHATFIDATPENDVFIGDFDGIASPSTIPEPKPIKLRGFSGNQAYEELTERDRDELRRYGVIRDMIVDVFGDKSPELMKLDIDISRGDSIREIELAISRAIRDR